MASSRTRTLLPTTISFILPLSLRLTGINLHPLPIFIAIGIYALVSEKGYRYSLNRWSPEFSEYTGPFSHVGVCVLAHIFVEGVPGWRGEVVFWSVFVRWAVGLKKVHREGVDVYRSAYAMHFRAARVRRLHAVLAASVSTALLYSKSMDWIHTAVVWLHFYHSMGYMFALAVYFCCPDWRRDLVEECRKRELYCELSERFKQYRTVKEA
ncbi:unnamed protein product [Periconia digitata]|uniref:Uncharacterized protein n=1 Tax=Periconia digitata TaxID=1303443 RepID=A0A9W4U292_9PLEO|nr:unnamed protein product [Periconia digitata]